MDNQLKIYFSLRHIENFSPQKNIQVNMAMVLRVFFLNLREIENFQDLPKMIIKHLK